MANSEEKSCAARNQNYVSCIKIHGMTILPPLLNETKRKHMQYYRELAVKAEQRIKWRKIKQQSFDSTDEGQSPTYFDSDSSSISDGIVCSSDDNTLKSQLTFSENCQDDVLRMLKDKEQTRTCANAVKMPSLYSTAIAKVPFLNDSDNVTNLHDLPLIDYENMTIGNSGNKLHLTTDPSNANDNNLNKSAIENSCDNSIIIRNLTLPNPNITLRQQSYTVDNSEQVFTDDILKEITTGSKSPENCCLSPENKSRIVNLNSLINNNETSDIIDKSMNVSVNSDIDSSLITCTESSNTPTSLVRSNSYILENPSPYLLAQMKREQESKNTGDSTRKQRRSWDFENARQKWSSIEHDLNATKSSNSKVKPKPSRQAFNSLPSSTAASPAKKMFNTSCDNLPKKFNLNKALKSNQHETPQKIKKYGSVRKPSPVPGRFVTPTRVSARNAEKELSPKKVHSDIKPKKLFTSCKTDLATREKVSQNKTSTSNKSASKSVDKNNEDLENSITSKMKSTKNSQGSKNVKSIEVDSLGFYKFKNSSPQQKDTNNDLVGDSIPSNMKRSEINCDTPENGIKSKSFDKNNEVPEYISAPQDRIREIIEKIQCDQSKKMAELVSRQKQEQELLLKTFSDQQILLLSTLKETYRICSTPTDQNDAVIEENQSPFNESEILKNSENLVLECKQLLKSDGVSEQSGRTSSRALCYTSLSSPDDTLANLTLTSEQNDNLSRNSNNHELSLCHGINSPVYQVVTSAKYSRQFSEDSLETGLVTANSLYNGNSVITKIEKNVIVYNDRRRNSIPCNNQHFPTQKQIWAASKINAAARGYLTRRLLRTERVQGLIQTIKDTLLCAMELHHETADNIQAADVELHRRLVQQVTAACFTFHDMFFDISIEEQMSVIALDRERLREKLLRPQSARSSSSLTSTTQRVLQRKLRRASNDSVSNAYSRSSSSKSNHSASERKSRSKTIGASGNV